MIGVWIYGKLFFSGILLSFGIMLCSSEHKCVSKKTDMEITKEIINENRINNFIEVNFDRIDSEDENPIFPHKINYKSKGNAITFCNQPVSDVWALKFDSSYVFFLAMKEESNLVNVISESYGLQDAKGELDFEVNGQPNHTTFNSWQVGKLNIYLTGFRRFDRLDKYKGCTLLIIGNLEYENTFNLPTLKAF